jgi:hypothetical protein
VFAPLVGTYVWFVRRSAADVLRMDFKQPVVVPRGQWHLFVGDGEWVIETRSCTLRRDDRDERNAEALRQLEDQKLPVVDFETGPTVLRLAFDLGGVLSIARSAPSEGDWAEECQWTLFHQSGSVSLDNALRLNHEHRRRDADPGDAGRETGVHNR